MSAVPSMNEAEELRRLIPLNTLPANRFEHLCSEIRAESAAKGSILFRQGDTTTEFVYVLSGTVSLQAGGVEMDSVTGGSDVSRFALAHQNPRKVSAVAKTPLRYVRIDPDAISQREEAPPAGSGHEAGDAAEASEGDWMSALLRSPVFQRLPPANLQALLRNIDEIEVEAGQVICRQDDPGDYFYIIKSGQCALTRKPAPAAKEIRLATLKPCDTFGEDALISEKPRTLTVTMDTDGRLLRLDKANFLKWVRDPVISRLVPKEAVEMVRQGGIWLDVRLPDHYAQGHPRGNRVNAPFFSLRMILPTLDRHRKYVCVCEDGKLSEAAAYLLLRFRFNACVLQGGLPSLPAEERIAEAAPAASTEAPEPRIGEPDTAIRLIDYPAAGKPEPVPPELEVTPHSVIAGEEVPGAAVRSDVAGQDGNRAPRDEHDFRGLEARLSRLLDEKERSDAELQQARQAVHRLETALRTLQRDHERLLQERVQLSGTSDLPEPVSDRSLRQELENLKTRYSELMFEKESADQEVASLETQVGDLKALVQEFLEQGEFPADATAEALRAELQTVREHAGSELAALRASLSEAEAENGRLRTELQTIIARMSVREAADSVPAQAPIVEHRSLASGIVWSVTVGLLLTVVILGALFGSTPGRDLVRAWLSDPPPQEVSN